MKLLLDESDCTVSFNHEWVTNGEVCLQYGDFSSKRFVYGLSAESREAYEQTQEFSDLKASLLDDINAMRERQYRRSVEITKEIVSLENKIQEIEKELAWKREHLKGMKEGLGLEL